MYDKRVKDKHIKRASPSSESYVAVVVYYQDTPQRDAHKPISSVWNTVRQAQKWLDKFPRDIWDGYDKDDRKYVETDERHRNVRKGNHRAFIDPPETVHPSPTERMFGRSFARSD